MTNINYFRNRCLLTFVVAVLVASAATAHAVSAKYAVLARKTRSANTATRAAAYMRSPQMDRLTLEVRHADIEERLAVTLPVERVVAVVRALGCDIVSQALADDTVYTIMVPSFRTPYNICNAEDLIQEIGKMHEDEDALLARAPRPADLTGTIVTSSESSLLADIAACCCNLTNVIGPDAQGICDAARWSTIDGIQLTQQSVIGWLKTIMIELRGFCQPAP